VSALLRISHLTVEFPAQDFAAVESDSKAEPSFLARASAGISSSKSAAVRDLSFSIAPGEVVGVVGESGSGKSVTSLALMRLLPKQAKISGQIFLTGKNGVSQRLSDDRLTADLPADDLPAADLPAADLLNLPEEAMRRLRGSRMAMIFQEPMTALNPVMRVGDQIAEAVFAHNFGTPNIGAHYFGAQSFGAQNSQRNKISKKQAWERAVEAMAEVAIPDPAQRARDYPYQLSGGMRQRVMIAMAIVNRPQLLIADEPTTALDVTIQAQILKLLAELRAKFGLTMLFISHDLAVVSQIADRVAVMYAGSLVEIGSKEDIFRRPAHPYTQGLLNAVPTLKTERGRPLQTIEGTVPPLNRVPPGCPFEPRCEFRIPDCSRSLPQLVEVASGHWARCPVVNAG
jgi:peptide/nickel transport system ATP-binding protein